jgi:phage tail sheath gpL-like
MSGIPVVIPGFPSSNRVPGAYGQVVNGGGAQSAASLPKTVLCVGLKTSAGTVTPDEQVAPILSTSDADNYAGPGSEGACMLYDAVTIAAQIGVPVYYASPTPAGGAVAATTNVKFVGQATAQGQITARVNGQPISQGINIGDTAAVVAANFSNAINGFGSGRMPLSASNSTAYTTIASKTAGVRGNQHVVFLDTTELPAGITATLYVAWTASTTWAVGDQVIPTTADGLYFECTTAGAGGGTQPTWPTTPGSTVTDGAATWTCWGSTATGNVPTTAVFLGEGSGLETYTNLLETLTSQSYDRIALAANDATSLAAWKVQVDQYAAAPNNFLQHVDVCLNGTLAAATSLAQTTLNDSRFQFLWTQNGETHPSREAAQMSATRAQYEQSNPNASYDGYALTLTASQSQKPDWPTLAVLISAINNSVTPVCSSKDNPVACVIRSITTKSLTGGYPDYSVIDTGDQVVPDFVLQDGKLYWSSVIQPNNPVCQDDPPPNEPQPPSGVYTPSRAVSAFSALLQKYALGILSSSPVSGGATVPPIVIAPLPGDVSATFDDVAQRIMVSEVVRVMPINHQIGISVIQQAA